MSTDITDIVVDLNDFLIVANMGPGARHMATHGGVSLMLQSVAMEEKYLLKKFLRSIESIPGDTNLQVEHFYEGVRIPALLADHLLDANDDDIILAKIREHLDQTASWMERSGLKGIAELSFDTSKAAHFRRYNQQNLELVKQLQAHGFRVHCLGNCSRRGLANIVDVHGALPVDSITTSSDLNALKCSEASNSVIFEKFLLQREDLSPDSTLFIEVNQGYRDALYDLNPQIQSILYQGKAQKRYFVKELSELLQVELDYDRIQSV